MTTQTSTGPRFSDPKTIAAGDLAIGDFIVSIPAQHGFAATDIRSAVKTITPHFDRWYMPAPRRGGRRQYMPSVEMTFLTGPGYHIPASWSVVVRRPEGTE